MCAPVVQYPGNMCDPPPLFGQFEDQIIILGAIVLGVETTAGKKEVSPGHQKMGDIVVIEKKLLIKIWLIEGVQMPAFQVDQVLITVKHIGILLDQGDNHMVEGIG